LDRHASNAIMCSRQRPVGNRAPIGLKWVLIAGVHRNELKKKTGESIREVLIQRHRIAPKNTVKEPGDV